MPRHASRPYSRYSKDAVILLGQLIRRARIEKKMTVEELADRADMSRGLVQRIERGDLGCTIGAVFEAAAIVGVPLFDTDQATLTNAIASNTSTLTLLPKAVRAATTGTKDDF